MDKLNLEGDSPQKPDIKKDMDTHTPVRGRWGGRGLGWEGVMR